MSRMSQLVLDIQDEIAAGLLSFQEIATKYQVPLSWVDEVACEMADQYYNDQYDSLKMDGDFDSAMASAGYGTDEDYGYYGD